MNPILMLQLTVALLTLANGKHLDVQQISGLVNQSVAIAVESSVPQPTEQPVLTQWATINPASPDGIVVPTSTTPEPDPVFIPTPASYSVFNQPSF